MFGDDEHDDVEATFGSLKKKKEERLVGLLIVSIIILNSREHYVLWYSLGAPILALAARFLAFVNVLCANSSEKGTLWTHFCLT